MTTDAAFWDGIAERYAKKPVENPDAFERKIDLTKRHMEPTDVVLDIGCGTGSLALRLAPHAAHVHGLDLSTEMIRIARDKAEASGTANVTFHCGPFDERFTACAPESLDGVCAYSILHLLDDRPAALRRIHRLLKPGGFFIASTACLGETWVPYGPLLRIMRALGKAPKVGVFSKRALVEEMERAGFVEVEQPDVGAKAIIGFTVARKPA